MDYCLLAKLFSFYFGVMKWGEIFSAPQEKYIMPCKFRVDIGLIWQMHQVWLERHMSRHVYMERVNEKTQGNKAITTYSISYKFTTNRVSCNTCIILTLLYFPDI